VVSARYSQELAGIEDAYAAACAADLEPLTRALETTAANSAIMIGSGGSFSVASFAAFLHQAQTGRLASALTPLEYLDSPLRDSGVICFSASGKNKDIGAAFEEAALREVRPLIALVMREASPLHDLAEKYRYAQLVSAPSPHFRDGFLAVGSLIGACTLLARGYRALLGAHDLPNSLKTLVEGVAGVALDRIVESSTSALTPSTTSVLFTASLKPAAVDIGSRFVEAALGNVHCTDLRNFGHGRHHWFAKHADSTGIVALIGDDRRALANDTLALLPETVPRVRFDFRGPTDLQGLVGMVIGLHLAAAGGSLRGIDPAKPGVPEFGRRLYHLGPKVSGPSRKMDPVEVAAWRKRNASLSDPAKIEDEWTARSKAAITRLEQGRLGGIVLDYDGTLCEAHRRFDPLSQEISEALTRLLCAGAIIGIATGRGGSAAERIREALPKRCWERVIIGYYNGSIISSLDIDPVLPGPPSDPAATRLETELRASPHFTGAKFRVNEKQISITIPALEEPLAAMRAATDIVDRFAFDVAVRCSSHSVDITFGPAAKTNVVSAVRCLASSDDAPPILRVGDKGRWPGNDVELLDDPYGLSVDEVSPSPEGCWGFSPRGVLGVQACLYYLNRLHWGREGGAFDLNRIKEE
jgi:fructoselysine-6-P-deglycase FrlB-like protein